MSGSEPSDAIRAVNALLTCLDGLRRFPNALVLTTSNITGAIDLAFVDRADIKVGDGDGGGAVKGWVRGGVLLLSRWGWGRDASWFNGNRYRLWVEGAAQAGGAYQLAESGGAWVEDHKPP